MVPQTESGLEIYQSFPLAGKKEFVPHRHAQLELAYFESGKGIYSVTGRTYPIESGDVFLFSNDEIHKITEVCPSVPMRILNIHFLPRFLWDGAADADDRFYLSLFWDREADFSHRINRCNPKFNSIQAEISNINAEWNAQYAGFELMIKYYIIKILVLLSRHFYPATGKDQEYKASRDQFYAVQRATDDIDRNFTRDLSVKALADAYHLSHNTFSAAFRTLNGVTPCRYINTKRIDRAVMLLKRTDRTVLDIALDCGFHNTANFNKAFKKALGQTPSEYRSIYEKRD